MLGLLILPPLAFIYLAIVIFSPSIALIINFIILLYILKPMIENRILRANKDDDYQFWNYYVRIFIFLTLFEIYLFYRVFIMKKV